jgi:hypothetical protein
MTVQGGASSTTANADNSHSNNLEFLTRLAEDLRAKSGSDLPLSCFVEQAKMQLSHDSPPTGVETKAAPAAGSAASATSDCFRAWAMPEDVSALTR